jgi:TPR repeat protein
MKGFLAFPVLLILLFGTPASADFQKGFDAYESGDYATALKEFRSLADKGDAGAQYNLGLMYDNGDGVTQDYNVAASWYKLAAEQGLAEAQYELGLSYDIGQGVTQDYKTAFKWYRLAAEQGHANAQFNLGQMYTNGLGVTRDNTRAYMWWHIAASQGHERADVYRSRVEKLMTPAQLEKARQLVREAIAKIRKASPKPTKPATEQIIAADYYKLGRAYALGQDVTKDLTRAYMWWHIAASKGNEDATRGRGIIEEQMTPAQVEKALELASECVTKGYKDC